jgi:hypothetical protein
VGELGGGFPLRGVIWETVWEFSHYGKIGEAFSLSVSPCFV